MAELSNNADWFSNDYYASQNDNTIPLVINNDNYSELLNSYGEVEVCFIGLCLIKIGYSYLIDCEDTYLINLDGTKNYDNPYVKDCPSMIAFITEFDINIPDANFLSYDCNTLADTLDYAQGILDD